MLYKYTLRLILRYTHKKVIFTLLRGHIPKSVSVKELHSIKNHNIKYAC